MQENWALTPRSGVDDRDSFDEMTVVLDTLIQRNAPSSPAGILAIANEFPNQALILAARLPDSDAERMLLNWYLEGNKIVHAKSDANVANRQMLARISAMTLVKRFPRTIAGSILADSMERLVVSVHDVGKLGVDHCLVDCPVAPNCGPETIDDAQPRWPPVYQYILEEYPFETANGFHTSHDPILVDAGADDIHYRRYLAQVHQNYCFSPLPLNAVNRHHLLAQLLGSDGPIPSRVQRSSDIGWSNDRQFLAELAALVARQEASLDGAVGELYSMGLITDTDAATIRPRLAVSVFDDREPVQPAHSALPLLTVKDWRTTVRNHADK
jgi:hypothetical protein